jgi:heme a synthase
MHMHNPARKAVVAWMSLLLILFAFLIVIGGMPRLLSGQMPPLAIDPPLFQYPMSEADWSRAFAAAETGGPGSATPWAAAAASFKKLYFWKFALKAWTAMTAVLTLLPFLWFLLVERLKWKRLSAGLLIRLAVATLFAGMGLWIASDGSAPPSPARPGWRLLVIAPAVWCFAWTATGLRHEIFPRPRNNEWPGLTVATALVCVLFAAQAAIGARMAGLEAGRMFNTFPLMDGRFFPSAAIAEALPPGWINFLSNPPAVQFAHRWLGLLLLGAVIGLWVASVRRNLTALQRRGFNRLLSLGCIQTVLGIATLSGGGARMPVLLASAHAMAAVLMLAAFPAILQSLSAPFPQERLPEISDD